MQVPQSTAFFPPAFSAILPPTVQAQADVGSVEKIRPYVHFLLEHFGSDRMLWGSDWPVCLLTADYQNTLNVMRELLAGMDADGQAKVFGRNAIAFYHLDAA